MKKSKTLMMLSFMGLIILLTVMLSTTIFGEDSRIEKNPTKTYLTIQVNANDTLWSIADEYMNDDYYDHETYINEVVSINRIKNNVIYAGSSITVPIIE